MHNPSTTSTSSSAAESHRSGGEKCLALLVPLYLALSHPASRTSPGLRPAAPHWWSCYNMLVTPGLVDQNGYWTIFFWPLGDMNWIHMEVSNPWGYPSHHPAGKLRKLGATWIRSGAAYGAPNTKPKLSWDRPMLRDIENIGTMYPSALPPSLAVQPANRPGHCHLDCTE